MPLIGSSMLLAYAEIGMEVDMYVDVVKLDTTAKPVVLGRISLMDGKVTFADLSDGMRESLRSIKVGDKTFTPADGEVYVRALPKYLHGDYLWATEVKMAALVKEVAGIISRFV